MALRNDINAQFKNDLINYNSAIDGQAYILLGNTVMGDTPTRFYYYDASSSATADGENVLSATGMGGVGRFIKLPVQEVNPDWNSSSGFSQILNKPSLAAVATSGDYDDLINKPTFDQVPSGVVVPFAGNSAPSGYLLCDGSAVSRSTYSALFSVIGTTYGVGDGSTTFNLPDTRQRFTLGKSVSGTGSTLGATGGNIDHVHTVNPPSTTTSGPSGVNGQLVGIINVASADHTHTVDIPEFNSGPNNPPFITFNYIIKI